MFGSKSLLLLAYIVLNLSALHQNTTMIGISNFCPKITRHLFTLNNVNIIQYSILQLELEKKTVFVWVLYVFGSDSKWFRRQNWLIVFGLYWKVPAIVIRVLKFLRSLMDVYRFLEKSANQSLRYFLLNLNYQVSGEYHWVFCELIGILWN